MNRTMIVMLHWISLFLVVLVRASSHSLDGEEESFLRSGSSNSEEQVSRPQRDAAVRALRKSNLLFQDSIFEESLNRGICVDRPGGERCYNIYIPRDAPGGLPLILSFHASNSDAESQASYSGLIDIAREQKSFVVAWPDGHRRSFNAGFCCDGAVEDNVDDVGLVRAILEEILANVDIDPTRIYATGYSNGAAMAYYLAWKLPEYIAAVATISYGFNNWYFEQALDARNDIRSGFHPVSLLSINGYNDQLNCWTDSCVPSLILDRTGNSANSREGWHSWALLNHCEGEPVTISEKFSSTFQIFDDHNDYQWIKAYQNCAGGIEVRQILNSRNHAGEWLGKDGLLNQKDYAETMVEFLLRWRLIGFDSSSRDPICWNC